MKNRQLSLSDIQKDYISKEEFYQIAHICKETALWLIETGRVSAEKPKRKGFGYKIAKEEVERYLADRQQNPLYYLKGKRHNCIPYTPPQPYSSELGGAIRLAVEQEMSSLPDLLTEKQVCAILGYRPKQILDWKHSGKLIALKCFRFLYKGIIIKHNKTEPTYTKTSLFLCEKRRFFMARTEKGVVTTI